MRWILLYYDNPNRELTSVWQAKLFFRLQSHQEWRTLLKTRCLSPRRRFSSINKRRNPHARRSPQGQRYLLGRATTTTAGTMRGSLERKTKHSPHRTLRGEWCVRISSACHAHPLGACAHTDRVYVPRHTAYDSCGNFSTPTKGERPPVRAAKAKLGNARDAFGARVAYPPFGARRGCVWSARLPARDWLCLINYENSLIDLNAVAWCVARRLLGNLKYLPVFNCERLNDCGVQLAVILQHQST